MSSNPLFNCPIHLGVMTNPCTTPCGHTFDRSSIQGVIDAASGGPISCPTCRDPFPTRWRPVVNYDLKAIIEQATAATPAAAPTPATPPPPPTPVRAVKRKIHGGKTHIQLSVPDGTRALPLDVYTTLDISGSMDGHATQPKQPVPGEAVEITSLLNRSTLTVHSVRALASSLTDKDRLAILGFDTSPVTYLGPTAMTAGGKAAAIAKLPQIMPRGGTSFWAGLKATLELVAANYRPGANTVIIFQTDGESDPSNDPVMGIPGALRGWKDAHPDIRFTLHTLGYGYGDALQMDMLRELAEIGGGTVGYIPDGSVLAQVAIHLFANLMTVTHAGVSMRLGAMHIPVGFIQAGQTRDFLVDGDGDAELVLSVPAIVEEGAAAEQGDETARDVFLRGVETGLRTAISPLSTLAQLQALPQTPYVAGLVSDMYHADKYKGQVGKAFTPENYHRWGRHYLPGVICGHRNQWAVNFKDEGGKQYGGEATRLAIAKGVDIYDALPPMKARYAPPPTYGGGGGGVAGYDPNDASVASPAVGGGGCFLGTTLVLMDDGTEKTMAALQKGDVVAGGFHVVCMVRYDVTALQAIVSFGAAELTEFHPIRESSGAWNHPCNIRSSVLTDVDAVFNVVLDRGHTLTLPTSPGSPTSLGSRDCITACSLAHNFEGKVISHSYFGKAVPDMPHCLDDLRSCKGWEKGYVICRNVKEVRDANGEIVQLTFEEA